ncbi:helix-turn-helix transcriptional regulator [Hoeflea sp. AS60]|uniref:helix-turn-helix transcriptional regulator n=1 Tax=Hoeflea sp. AS60 TaxID=3135780 RepID=UPI0031767BA7
MLSSRRFGIEDVSHHLNINARKLQRLLRAEGGSFRDVLDETRKALALAHLKEEHRSVAEVSHLLGYHDPNSFYRAFKGWTGTTTTSWRHEE